MARDNYQIQVLGRLSQRWGPWFDDMEITVCERERAPAITTLTGSVADQAALLGLLQKLYTLGLPLLLVSRQAAGDPLPPMDTPAVLASTDAASPAQDKGGTSDG
jgi:hypothetical protein